MGGVKIKVPKYYFCIAYPLGVRVMKNTGKSLSG